MILYFAPRRRQNFNCEAMWIYERNFLQLVWVRTLLVLGFLFFAKTIFRRNLSKPFLILKSEHKNLNYLYSCLLVKNLQNLVAEIILNFSENYFNSVCDFYLCFITKPSLIRGEKLKRVLRMNTFNEEARKRLVKKYFSWLVKVKIGPRTAFSIYKHLPSAILIGHELWTCLMQNLRIREEVTLELFRCHDMKVINGDQLEDFALIQNFPIIRKLHRKCLIIEP
ncbi:hypothetical protein EGR_05523 [Echinococcus granulosus]|uniref:Uncharacterized protein n=1 Tax=Echinococcus granulosus TaxID=6210 RepID=W6V199_ECHGR|nr:hypothetical protein EGR_05523 [Echinococcus granulosus]EUB59624.1 hypothetical protein EGR_05523 [Echinococcus granulosus]